MIDPIQILEVTLYSKLLNEVASQFLLLEKMTMMYILFAFFIYKLVTFNYLQELMDKFKNTIVERYLKYKKYFDKMKDYAISPADVQNICFRYKNENAVEILNDIIAICDDKIKNNNLICRKGLNI